MKTFKQFLNEMSYKKLPTYKMQMKNLNRIVDASQKYKESPNTSNLKALKKANELALKVNSIISNHQPKNK